MDINIVIGQLVVGSVVWMVGTIAILVEGRRS